MPPFQLVIDDQSPPASFNVTGVQGPPGAAGQGVPAGGSTGQALAKVSGADFDTAWVSVSGVGGGATNLAYTASPTDGTVTSDTGSDATIPLVSGVNAGLMSSASLAALGTAIQPGDLATVATTGAYGDLTGVPLTFTPSAHTHTLSQITDAGTAAAAATGDFATAAQGALAGTAVQPLDAVSTLTNDAGYTANAGTVTSVALTAGAGITVTGGPVTGSGAITVANAAPDQVVGLTAGANITVTGAYPNFSIAAVVPTGALADLDAVTISNIAAIGTPSASTFLRGDGSWAAPAGGGGGDLLAANNLSDLASIPTARANLGLTIGTNVQAYSAILQGTTASFLTADRTKLDGIEAGADVTDTLNVTAAGALMDSEVSPNLRTLTLPATTTITAYGATLTGALTAEAGRTVLGLGTAATTAATAYATAAQGALADTSVQPANLAAVATTGAYADLTGVPLTFAPAAHTHTLANITDAGTAAAAATGDFATAAQGALADTAVQPAALAGYVASDTTGITGASAIVNAVSISQANYDAIVTPDPAVLYVIV